MPAKRTTRANPAAADATSREPYSRHRQVAQAQGECADPGDESRGKRQQAGDRGRAGVEVEARPVKGRQTAAAVSSPAPTEVRIRIRFAPLPSLGSSERRRTTNPTTEAQDPKLHLGQDGQDGQGGRGLAAVLLQLAQAQQQEDGADGVGLAPDGAVEPRDGVDDDDQRRR